MDLSSLLKSLKNKHYFIIFLIILIIVLIVISFLFSKKTKTSPITSPSFSPLPSFEKTEKHPHFSILPKTSQPIGDPAYYQEISNKLNKRFPLTSHLPYETEKLKISYSGPFQLKVSLKTASPSASLKKEINQWIRSNGVDPSTHEIIFK